MTDRSISSWTPPPPPDHLPAIAAEFGPATRRLAGLVRGVADAELDAPTPCPRYSVGAIIDHVGGLSMAFAAAAVKDELGGSAAASGDASQLDDGWRDQVDLALTALADAWQDPEAWTGATKVGGIDLPGEIAGLVGLNEVVVHGWDLAVALGRSYSVDPGALEALETFLAPVPGAPPATVDGPFGPPVPVPPDAPALDRLVGLAGRDPSWTPPGTSR